MSLARNIEKADGQIQANIRALKGHLQAASSRLNEVLQHAPNTLGYRVRERFACGLCCAKGRVAVPVMCPPCR